MCQLSSHSLLKPTSFKRIGSLFVMSWVGLTGCGQTGNLYMPEQANPNTEFFIYKHNQNKDKKQDEKLGNKQKNEEIHSDHDALKPLTPPANTTIDRQTSSIDALPEAQNY